MNKAQLLYLIHNPNIIISHSTIYVYFIHKMKRYSNFTKIVYKLLQYVFVNKEKYFLFYTVSHEI